MKCTVLVLALVATACSIEKSSEPLCSNDHPACPAGMVCNGTTCVEGQADAAVPDAPVDIPRDVEEDSIDSTPDSTPDKGFEEDVFIDPCEGKGDGDKCGEDGMICVKAVCVVPSCGDGYVSAPDEECEDDNDIAGDGCTACMFDCKADKDCDDTLVCNGTETCDTSTHTCQPGVAAADGKACDPPTDGVCKSGGCVAAGCGNGVKDPGEDCDDENDIAADGCENDCTFSCTTNADCDDGNNCNGGETCNAVNHICKPGTNPIKCTIPSGADPKCTVACEPSTGKCIFADADGDLTTCDTDCNDNNPLIYPGAAECADTFDNDCDPNTKDGADGDCQCWQDGDGDGYATTSASTITASPCPTGYTDKDPAVADDCKEGNASVSPAQTGWFTEPYCKIKISANTCVESFDYNCSDAEEKQYPSVRDCKIIGYPYGSCQGAGWISKTVPNCGDKAFYGGCTMSTGVCQAQLLAGERAQPCH